MLRVGDAFDEAPHLFQFSGLNVKGCRGDEVLESRVWVAREGDGDWSGDEVWVKEGRATTRKARRRRRRR